jgi:hypothetical protein
MTPDEAVVEAIATVLRRFEELGSGRQVLLSLREDGLLLPRRPDRRNRITWAPATYPAVHDFLTNPAYAGAFVFGRTKVEKRIDGEGRLVVRTRQVARDEWEVCIPDHQRRRRRHGEGAGRDGGAPRPPAGRLRTSGGTGPVRGRAGQAPVRRWSPSRRTVAACSTACSARRSWPAGRRRTRHHLGPARRAISRTGLRHPPGPCGDVPRASASPAGTMARLQSVIRAVCR